MQAHREQAPGPAAPLDAASSLARAEPSPARSVLSGGVDRAGAAEKTTVAPQVGTFHALGLRDYRFLWSSNIFSSAGMWVQMATLGWIVYDITGSGTLLGAINGMRAIPFLLLAPLAGVAADRLNRRNLMLSTQMVIVLTTLLLALGFMAGRIEVWHLFAFTLIGSTSQILFMPVQQTVVFDLVPRHVIPNAVALSSAAFNVTRVLGPSAAGLLIAALGPQGNFLLQSALYLGAAGCIALIVFPARKGPPQKSSLVENIAEGFRYVARERSARTLLLLAVIPPFLIIPSFIALMPVFAKDVFHSGPGALGLLLSASGLGGLLGALFAASLGRFERRGALQLAMLVVASGALLGFAFMDSMRAALPLLVVAGFCEMVYMATNMTLLQLSVPDAMRGRVTSIFMLTMGLMPVASLLSGTAVDFIGAQAVVKVTSAAALVAGGLIAAAIPWVRELRLSQISPTVNAVEPLATHRP